MAEIDKQEVHSEEIQELMGFVPKGIVRWGLSIISIIFSGIFIGCIFFKSPEIITAPMILITKNPPVSLLSKSTGKIDKLFVKDGQSVDEGSAIALINNPTNYNDYLRLKKQLKFNSNTSWDEQVLTSELSTNPTLGELQIAYSSFLKNRNNFKQYLIQNLIPQKIEIIKAQILKQKEYYKTQINQRDLQKKDLILSERSFFRDSFLFKNKIITEEEYDKAQQSLLGKKTTSIGFDAILKSTESSILQMEGNLIELQMQLEKELSLFRLDLDESKQNLDNLVHQWEERYLIKSPIKGIMTYTTIWSANQEVKLGDLISTVIPQGAFTIIAKAVVPTKGFGKVEVGQRVNIKLAGFPYMEFGMLKGRIGSISLVPGEKGYVANIDLEDGMTSSYKENLRFIQQMDGTAEIVTKDLRLIYRFINPLRALFDKGL